MWMQRINESQAKTKSTRSVGQMRIIYSFSSQYKNVAVYMTMSAKLRRSKLNMATSGTILSLPARRPLRKPSDGGDGAVAEQASSRSGGKATRDSTNRLPRPSITWSHAARPLASRVREPVFPPPPSSPSRPTAPHLFLPFSRSQVRPISHCRARQNSSIPLYSCCPAYAYETAAKGVTRSTARSENIRLCKPS